MRIESIVLAEGLGQDSRGALTAIGLSQNVYIAESLPATTKRAVVVHMTECAEGESLAFTFTVKDPSGKVNSAQSGEVRLGKALFRDLPVGADLPVETAITFTSMGTYTIGIEVRQSDGTTHNASVPLHVVEPAARRTLEELAV